MSKERLAALIGILVLITGSIYYFEVKKNKTGPSVSQGEFDITPRIDISNSSQGNSDTEGSVNVGEQVPRPASKEEQQVVIDKSQRYPLAKEISSPDGFLNTDTDGILIQELIGKKVILVDFWTYSCINCQRTQPYLNAWYKKYKDQGLEIIGIHTPEFEFEKDFENVRQATQEAGINYPVILDNDYSTWHAYKNRFWPRKYLIDIDGFIVYDHIGEGAYEETEHEIQRALAERKTVLGESGLITSSIANPQGAVSPEFRPGSSPEIYFGTSRNTYMEGGTKVSNGIQSFSIPSNPQTNILYLNGRWNMSPEYAESVGEGTKIVFRYRAKNVYMVASSGIPMNITIKRDGEPVTLEAGKSVQNGVISVEDEKLYHLISEEVWSEHTLEIVIPSSGFQAFTFTFG